MSENTYDYVIIGNSTAAIAAVESLRRTDPEGSLALISCEPQAAYCAPLITYVLAGKIPEERLNYRPADFYERERVDTFLGQAATAIDASAHTVSLADGRALHYGKLLLACGGEPIVPPLPGVDLEGVFTFTRYGDMLRVQEFLQAHEVKDAVVVGGGMIGVKTAEALPKLHLNTTVVELLPRILAQALDETGSVAAQRALEEHGARVLTSTGATALEGEGGLVSGVRLDNGELLPAQLVILAIGVRPNLQLAKTAGLQVNRGVLVDDRLRTSDPDIYAAGDVTEGHDVLLGEARPVAIWPGAYLQGEAAGINMAGGEAIYEGGVPMNSIQICGLPTISVGLTDPARADEVLQYLSPDGQNYRRIFLREGRIIGAIFVGEIDRAGIITGLIREGIDVSDFKEKLISRELGLLSLPKAYRRHKVSGPGIEV
jgi:NAD(P)H-nitrite reductase large subunit